MKIAFYLKRIDWLLLLFGATLSFFGLILLYSFSSSIIDSSLFYKQLIFLVAGIVVAIGISIFNFRVLKESSLLIFVLYFLFVLLLAGVFVFGREIRGARSWYDFGFFNFQPVEFLKIIFIVLFAKYFSQRHIDMYQMKHVFLSVLYAAIPIALVFFQPDFGSVMILAVLWFGMMLVSGIKRAHISIILAAGTFALVSFWLFLFTDEQKERFFTLLDPEYDPMGSGYHVLQSIITVGSGGFLGKGFSEPYTQAKLGFLPEVHTDFIFAGFCEMFGLLGVIALFSLFALFFWRLFIIVKRLEDNFSRLLVSGFMIMIGAEIFINIGMNIGLLPITGIPLPFLSYGGSSLLSLFIGIGIIESVKSHSN